jgi:hypothetical protein
MCEEIKKGIAAYDHEQRVFIRLLRRRGTFTEKEFDSWFSGRKFRKRRVHRFSRDTFILGIGINGGTLWAEMLDLLKMMVVQRVVDAKTVDGVVTYSLVLVGGFHGSKKEAAHARRKSKVDVRRRGTGRGGRDAGPRTKA